MTLLRASDFCRRRRRSPPPRRVRLRILEAPPPRRTAKEVNTRGEEPHFKLFTPETTVYLSEKRLILESLKHGDVAWIIASRRTNHTASTTTTTPPSNEAAVKTGTTATRRVAVQIAARCRRQQKQEPAKLSFQEGEEDDSVEISPVLAASLGYVAFPWRRNEKTATPREERESEDEYWLEWYPEPLEIAGQVTVRPLGRPVAGHHPTSSSQTSLQEYPNLESSNGNDRLLTVGSFLSILSSSSERNQLYLFQVASARLPSSSTQNSTAHKTPQAFVASRTTQWNLEAWPSGLPLPQLGPLSQMRRFQELLSRGEKKDHHTQKPPPPQGGFATKHPSVSSRPPLDRALLQALWCVPGSSSTPQASHAIFHAVGTDAAHAIQTRIAAAADALGRRCLDVRGLAAYAHSTVPNKAVSTGGWIDQCAGLQEALRRAHASQPCLLHLRNVNLEFPQEDEPLRHQQEEQLWNVLVNALSTMNGGSSRQDDDDFASVSFRHRSVPPVVVMLSTTRPLAPGPLRRHLVWESFVLEPPDPRYLWNHDESYSEVHLQGRSARETFFLQRQWQHGVPLETACQQLEENDSLQTNRGTTAAARIPSVHWKDVGGLAHVRSEIMDAIELPLHHPHLFPTGGGRSGILLYGPPGTGKTLVAKAVATECGLPFLSVKGPELLGSYVGESETNVRAIFGAARSAARAGSPNRTTRAKHHRPAAILFFDELDSLAPRRGGLGDGGGVMERVVSTLLTELDGRPTASSSQTKSEEACQIFVIGATNRPDLLDPSLLRPGRLDRLVYLGLASTLEDRAQILAALLRTFRLDPPDPLSMARQVVEEFPANLSGADFSAIASGAMGKSLERVCNAAEEELRIRRERSGDEKVELDDILNDWDEAQLTAIVTSRDLIEAAKDVRPSVKVDELEKYEQLRTQFSSTAVGPPGD